MSVTPRRKPPDPGEPTQSLLVQPRDQFEAVLDERIAAGQAIQDQEIVDAEMLQSARDEYYTWNEYNVHFFRVGFSSSEESDSYAHAGARIAFDQPFQAKVRDFRDDVRIKIRRLVSLKARLDLMESPSSTQAEGVVASELPDQIFLVHGHDGDARRQVTQFVEQVAGQRPVVLHEQTNQGRTIIEKFERHGGRAAFAIALLTSDDEGRAKGENELRPRARQNVVFEAGFFFGAVGRANTAIVYEPGVDPPSDLSGIAYIELDPAGAWKFASGANCVPQGSMWI